MWSLFKNTNPDRHFRDVIKSGFDETNKDVMILRASLLDFNTRSKVQVNNGELAIFLQNGEIVQVLEPSTTAISTANYPFISNFLAILQNGIRSNACSLFFVRTIWPRRPIEWGTNNTRSIADPQYENMVSEVGGSGTFSFRLGKEHLQEFFSEFVGGNAEAYTYEDLAMLLQPSMTQLFFKEFTKVVNERQAVDGLDPSEFSDRLSPVMVSHFMQNYGLELREYTVNGIVVTDSDAKMKMKDTVVVDKSERMRIMREALQVSLMREAEAEGKMKELAVMGDQWLKVKVAELAETALANPAIANIGTTALGGYLGTHSDMLGDMVNGLVGTLGEKSNAGSKEQPKAQKKVDPADIFAPMSQQSQATPTDDFAPAASQPENAAKGGVMTPKEKAIKKLTDLYIKGMISEDFYNQQIEELN